MRQQLLIVGVHGQLGGVAVVRAVLDVLAVAVLLQVVRLHSDAINLALFERQHLGRVVGNAGHLVVVRLILADVVAVMIAIPVVIAGQGVFLVQFEGRQLVRAVGNRVLHGTAVAGLHFVRFFLGGNFLAVLVEGLAGFVNGLVDQVGGRQGVGHIEVRFVHGVSQDEVNGVIVNLLEANLVPRRGIRHAGGVQVLSLHGLILLTRGEVVVKQVLCGDPRFSSGFVFNRGIAVHRVVRNVHILRRGIALRVQRADHAPSAHVEVHIGAGGNEVLGSVCNQVISRLARVEVVLRVVDDELTSIVAVSAAIQHLRVEQLLHRVHIVISGDGGAIFPLGELVQRDTPSLGGLAFLHAVLTDILSGHVHRHFSSQFGHDGVAILFGIQNEGVETRADIVQNISVFVRFPGERVPVQRRVNAGSVAVVGVHLFIGVVLASFADILIGRNRLRAPLALFQRDSARVVHALTDIVGISRRERAFCQRSRTQHHARRQDQRENLLHGLTPPIHFVPDDTMQMIRCIYYRGIAASLSSVCRLQFLTNLPSKFPTCTAIP